MIYRTWPDITGKTPIVRLGSTSGQKALTAYRKARSHRNLDITQVSVAVMWFTIGVTIDSAVTKFMFIALAGLSLLGFVATTALAGRTLSKFYHHIGSGDIVLIDDHLLAVWDELCAEHEVKLTGEDRDAELYKLTIAQSDVQDDLARRAKILDEPRLADTVLLHDARIRARLAQEVVRAKIEKAEREDMDRLVAPSSQPPWASSEEITEQVEILRRRRAHAQPELTTPKATTSTEEDTAS